MFVRGFNPVWFVNDINGNPLSPYAYASFLSNDFPFLPLPVYRDAQGENVWGQPIEFLTSGGLPDNLYFTPGQSYRVEFRCGPTQNDPLIQPPILNYIPAPDNSPDENEQGDTENQITNPQFAQTNFGTTVTIKTAGTYPIAPGWDLVLTGSGTTIVNQLPIAGNQNFLGNPPSAIQINNLSWNTAVLQQTFTGNGALFTNSNVAMSVLAKAETNIQTISLNYVTNTGLSIPIATGELSTGLYQTVGGAFPIPAPSENTATGSDAFTQMQIILPTNGTVDITNVQMYGTALPILLPYQEETPQRYIDHEFHVYASQLIYKPKKSLLVGWNFSQNPYQFIAIGLTPIAPQCSYIADQTILYQETADNIAIDNSQIGQRACLQIQPNGSATNSRFALIQFIDPTTIRPQWSYILSSLARLKMNSTVGTQIHIKMRLIWRTTLPPTLSTVEPIASWPVNADPIFASGWTPIVPNNDPSYLLSDSFSTNESPGGNAFDAYPFEGFALPNCSATTQTLAIVIYTMDRMVPGLTPPDSVAFDRISLLPNKFACDADTQTYDEVLRECQFYYEKSYQKGSVPGSAGATNGLQLRQLAVDYNGAGSTAEAFLRSFNLDFKQTKRALPALSLYSPITGAVNNFDTVMQNNGVATGGPNTSGGGFTVSALSEDSATLTCTNTSTTPVVTGTTATGQEGIIQFHYTLDARMGI